MNTKFIRYNLEEIQEEVEVILLGLKHGEAYTQEQFYHSVQHLVHHLNIAWNARNATSDEVHNADLTK